MNNNVCEEVLSTHNKVKINVQGYLMIKDKNRKNIFYWKCEKRKTLQCHGRATTMLSEGQHHLMKVSDHNHAAEASRVNVVRSLSLLKEHAQQTNDQLFMGLMKISACLYDIFLHLLSYHLMKFLLHLKN